MSTPPQPYHASLIALGVMTLLTLIQQLVAGTAKNVVAKGTPGVPAGGGHDSFTFRADRAHANTIENMVPFTLVILLAIWLGASPTWTNLFALVFLGARTLHMITYYADIRPLRTLCFLIGLASMFALCVLSLLRLF